MTQPTDDNPMFHGGPGRWNAPASSAAPQGAQPAEPVARIKFGYPGISGTGIRAIYRLPAADKLPEGEYLLHAAPVPQEVRMLTEDEVHDAYSMGWTGDTPTPTWLERIEAVERLLIKVNGWTIPAKEQTNAEQ